MFFLLPWPVMWNTQRKALLKAQSQKFVFTTQLYTPSIMVFSINVWSAAMWKFQLGVFLQDVFSSSINVRYFTSNELATHSIPSQRAEFKWPQTSNELPGTKSAQNGDRSHVPLTIVSCENVEGGEKHYKSHMLGVMEFWPQEFCSEFQFCNLTVNYDVWFGFCVSSFKVCFWAPSMGTGEWKESDAETAVYLQNWVPALVHVAGLPEQHGAT